ncbi:Gfo/Idh/MocA family protein [Denitrobaculum tricleocarpae]|uniref:Gfo/Idh/MocA family oxidoreductase n=1 Tax=Denitrobaculum tricleocarpae TaxID=2591009 RepID=A0A545U175_9PROT|nr:Gfo/Idh/MocA family oxidoreductase [Denitrobaculum tricleocarpae]TQV83229.1 Gfo/Idh/MocA family oxidoreductase [Denitrobaculum tricleocarpae]
MSGAIRVAILGAGIGREHLAAYRQLPERFEVKAVCDLDRDRAASIIQDNAIRIETDAARMLSDPEIDLIDVCLPPHLHFEMAVRALQAGKHVVCEKPLVCSLKEADALIEVAAGSKGSLIPVFQYRYGPAITQLHALMEAGLTGRPYAASLETHWNRNAEYYAVPWRGTWAGEQGGAVLGHAIHNHDLLMHILGPVARLSAMTTTRVNGIEVEDCAAISFQMENGAVASSSITLGAASDTTRLRICFEGLTAESGPEPYAPATGPWRFEAREPADQTRVDEVVASVPAVKTGFTGFFEALADSLAGQGGREVTLADGRRSIELVTAIYHASRFDKVVKLPLAAGTTLYESWIPTET